MRRVLAKQMARRPKSRAGDDGPSGLGGLDKGRGKGLAEGGGGGEGRDQGWGRGGGDVWSQSEGRALNAAAAAAAAGPPLGLTGFGPAPSGGEAGHGGAGKFAATAGASGDGGCGSSGRGGSERSGGERGDSGLRSASAPRPPRSPNRDSSLRRVGFSGANVGSITKQSKKQNTRPVVSYEPCPRAAHHPRAASGVFFFWEGGGEGPEDRESPSYLVKSGPSSAVEVHILSTAGG